MKINNQHLHYARPRGELKLHFILCKSDHSKNYEKKKIYIVLKLNRPIFLTEKYGLSTTQVTRGVFPWVSNFFLSGKFGRGCDKGYLQAVTPCFPHEFYTPPSNLEWLLSGPVLLLLFLDLYWCPIRLIHLFPKGQVIS